MTYRTIVGTLLGTALAIPAVAQETTDPAPICQAEQAALTAIPDEFAADQQRLKEEGDDLRDEAPEPLRISGRIVFEDEHMALDLPSVTMTDRRFGFDMPQVTMRQRGFKWSVPVVTMENKVIARVPSVRCTWLRCKTYTKEIITKVPVTRMEVRSASTDIPEFAMRRTDFVTAVPRVTMRRQDFYYKLPRITVQDPFGEREEIEAQGKKLKTEAEALSQRIDARSAERTDALFACHQTNLVAQRETAAASFETAIAQLNRAIDVVRASGADPAAFRPDEGGETDLVKQRDELIATRDAALAKIDEAIRQLGDRTTTAINAIVAA